MPPKSTLFDIYEVPDSDNEETKRLSTRRGQRSTNKKQTILFTVPKIQPHSKSGSQRIISQSKTNPIVHCKKKQKVSTGSGGRGRQPGKLRRSVRLEAQKVNKSTCECVKYNIVGK